MTSLQTKNSFDLFHKHSNLYILHFFVGVQICWGSESFWSCQRRQGAYFNAKYSTGMMRLKSVSDSFLYISANILYLMLILKIIFQFSLIFGNDQVISKVPYAQWTAEIDNALFPVAYKRGCLRFFLL